MNRTASNGLMLITALICAGLSPLAMLSIRACKLLPDPEKKKLRKILDAWEDE